MGCQACDGCGFIEALDDRVEPCACRVVTPTSRLEASGIPARERAVVTLKPHQDAALAKARPVLATGDGVILMGRVGLGKSIAAAALAREWVEAGKAVRWVDCKTLLRRIRDTFSGKGAETECQIVESLETPDLLVVDDLGAHKLSEWSVETMGEIVGMRDSAMRATVYTTNLPLRGGGGPSIESVYGDRVASRLSRCARIPMDGPDLRPRDAR